MNTKQILMAVAVMLACVCPVVAWAATLSPGGEFYTKPVHPLDVAQYEYKWGTSPGAYTHAQVITDPNDLDLTFAEAGLQPNTTYFAILETTLTNGQVSVSEELTIEIRDAFSTEFCLRGTYNGQAVDLCVPATLRVVP